MARPFPSAVHDLEPVAGSRHAACLVVSRHQVVDDLASAVDAADVVTCATMTTTPVIRGEWLRPGQHLDLIGAYRPDMREADDEVLRRGRLFVDARHTTIGHIGEVMIPMEAGVIGETTSRRLLRPFQRRLRPDLDDEITVFKNGGGAHLDLMCARYILDAVQSD
jgi:ornithine cyclodeaminase/alanine dehydrogenase-like protein (mu-crystallin family)